MTGVAGVLPHPVRKGDVASEQLLGVAAAAEPFPLGPLTDIEQADRDVDQRSRRSGHQLTRRHRVARQQQVPARLLEPYRRTDRRLARATGAGMRSSTALIIAAPATDLAARAAPTP
jgi:hypothetical protein